MTSPRRTTVLCCKENSVVLGGFDPAAAGAFDAEAVLDGAIGETAGHADGVDDRNAAAIEVAARLLDLADDVEGPEVQDLDADPRVLQIVGREPSDDDALEFVNRQSTGLHAADEGKRDRAVAGYREFPGHIHVTEHGDLDLVAGAQAVGCPRARALRGSSLRCRAEDRENHKQRYEKPPLRGHKPPRTASLNLLSKHSLLSPRGCSQPPPRDRQLELPLDAQYNQMPGKSLVTNITFPVRVLVPQRAVEISVQQVFRSQAGSYPLVLAADALIVVQLEAGEGRNNDVPTQLMIDRYPALGRIIPRCLGPGLRFGGR